MAEQVFTWKHHPVLGDLLARAPQMPLDAGRPVTSLHRRLAQLTIEELFAPASMVDHAMARCCLAGLWLRFNFLESAHRICQDLPTPSGSYWHGIVHRREGDYWNSKYWMRRVGPHPVFEPLQEQARRLCEALGSDASSEFLCRQARWDPSRFVDLVEACVFRKSQAVQLALQVQQSEWDLLFDYCYRHALGY